MKVTKYFLLLIIVFNFNLYGGSKKLIDKVNYEISYEETLKKAKKENKPIMMVVGQEECPWCNKFYVKTLTKETIDAKVQKDFIPITVLRYKDKFPKRFETKGVPTVLFIEPKKENIFYKSFGYKSKREYKTELETALDIFNNKYKLKY